MTRFDLYGKAHKGIRSMLFETAAKLARTDFADDTEVEAAAAAVKRLVAMLDKHAAVEDGVIMPALREVAPLVFHDLASEHARVGGLQAKAAALASGLAHAPVAERVAAGPRLLELVHALVAEHLQHMAREEGEANRALWAHRSDDELRALHRRILAVNTPAETAEFLTAVLPSVNRPERIELVGSLRAALPPPAFEALTAGARAALGPAAWAETVAAAAP
jgi:hypothetical protein